MPVWTQALHEVKAHLSAFQDSSEGAFLATGEHLREVHTVLQILSTLADSVAGRLASNDFQAILDTLTRVSDTLGARQRSQETIRTLLGTIENAARRVEHALGRLETLMIQVQMLAVNARIEAARLDGSAEDFTVFTRGIVQLAGEGRERLERVVGDVATLRAAATTALSRHEAFARLSVAVTGQLGEAVTLLRERQGRAAQAVQAFPEQVRTLGRHVATVVGGLQIHDITRQRLEHVTHGLDEMEATVSHAALAEQEQRLLINGTTTVQAEQVRESLRGYRTAVDETATALKTVADAVPILATTCARIFRGDAAEGTSFLMTITHDLEEVRLRFGRFMEASEQSAAALQTVGTAAQRAGALAQTLAPRSRPTCT
ncbi:MAG: methyl-accepting chemotaxis sensory transducer [Rhodospirillaceae bacterium]|nr:MAG: methyl-accepting chemotaxis sensory transducer [Rhodospirillaceae bacterium]